jgi:predicted acetyltransferase
MTEPDKQYEPGRRDTRGKGGARVTAGLRLRPLRADDEAAFRAAHRAVTESDGFDFALGLEPDTPWDAYLRGQADVQAGVNLPDHLVPAAFLVADVAGEIVGRISIRFELNDYLAREGGHVGYAVLPQFRRRGYAGEMLRQGVIVARARGVDRVLVICDDDNTGSATVIEACGGQLEGVVEPAPGAPRIRRYWID